MGGVAVPGSGVHDLAGVAERHKVVEYSYLPHSNEVASISRRMADGVGPSDQITAASPVVAYTYQFVAGRNRVVTEFQAQTGRSYEFEYEVDVDSALRVQKVTRTAGHDGMIKEWTLDDHLRVTSETEIAPLAARHSPRIRRCHETYRL